MPGPEFFQTRMGAVFFESTLPEIARQLKRIADALEAKQTTTSAEYDPEERLKKGFLPDVRGWSFGPDDTAFKVETVLRAFEYDTAHYTTEKLGDRVYFDAQMHDLVSLIIKTVLR